MSGMTGQSPRDFFLSRSWHKMDMGTMRFGASGTGQMIRNGTGTVTESVRGITNHYGLSNTLGNNTIEIFDESQALNNAGGAPANLLGFLNLPLHVQASLNSMTTDPAKRAGDCFMGIGIGVMAVKTPYSATYAGARDNTVLQFRYNFTLLRWEVMMHVQDGSPPDVFACTLNPSFSPDVWNCTLAIDFLPGVVGGTGAIARFYHDGNLIYELKNNARLDNFSGAQVASPLVLCMGLGSDATISTIDAIWGDAKYYFPFPASATFP